jgi:hypothetical protein
MATQFNALLALLFITFLPSTSSSNVATKYNTNNDTSVPFKKYISTNAVKKNKQWNHHPFKNKYTQGPTDLNLPSSTLKEEDTCLSVPALYSIKTKTTKKKNKNRSRGGNNFDAFFFPFTLNKNENQCFTLQEASVALVNEEKTHGDVSVDLKWNSKCLQDFENFNDHTNCGCTDPDLTLEDQEEQIIPAVTELLKPRGDVSTVGAMAQSVALAASDLGGSEHNVAMVRG